MSTQQILLILFGLLLTVVTWKFLPKRGGSQPGQNPPASNAGGGGAVAAGNQPPAAATPPAPHGPSPWPRVISALIVVTPVMFVLWYWVRPVGTRMEKWAASPPTVPAHRQLTPDEEMLRLDEVALSRYREILVERMQSAYDIPPDETRSIIEGAQGVPDSRVRNMFKIRYGIDIPDRLEHLPMVVEDVPKFTTVNGKRTETTTFLQLLLNAATESRLINPYGWVMIMTPPSGFPCEIEYNYYRDGQKTMTARFKNGKYYKVEAETETEIQVTDMPANDSFTLKLLPGVIGDKQFIVRRTRNYRI